MTMFLPSPDLHPTGSEITEFIDVPSMADASGKAGGPVVEALVSGFQCEG